MRKILIVEDKKSTRDGLIRMAYNINSSIQVLETGYASEALDFSINNHIIAFFLDIQLEDYSGLELAKQIRKIKVYEFTPIIFITAMPTRELEAFRQIHCYDYIIKPYTQNELERVFRKILVDYVSSATKENHEKLFLEFKGYTQLIALKDIMYIEYLNRKIVINTKNETIQYIHMSMKKFKTMLPDNYIQIHQSIIVNSKYIKTVELSTQCMRLIGEEKVLPIGRSYIKEVGERICELC